ncbi:MAG: TraB/GumN family protein [Pseudomonadota bacterium]
MRPFLQTFFLVLILAAAVPFSAGASETACAGTNILNELKNRKPAIYAEIERRAAVTINGDALLWRIEGGGASSASYLLGTMHLPDPRIAELSAAAKSAISEVSTVALELTGTDDHAAIQKELFANPQLITMQRGQTLWDAVEERHQPAVEAALLSLGMGREQVASVQPWLPSMMLALSPCFNKRTASGEPGVDQSVELLARSEGKTVIGLETAVEQFETLSGLSIETQAVMLADAARTYGQIADINETLVQLYLERRIGWILPFGQLLLGLDRTPREQAADREFIDSIMSKRNHVMDERAQEKLAAGGLMIAVGALHLPGEDGLVNLLRKRGYTLTAVE